jgi:hypothetical protein
MVFLIRHRLSPSPGLRAAHGVGERSCFWDIVSPSSFL